MTATSNLLRDLVDGVARRIIEHTDELSELDRAIGDGDHGLNMSRGCKEVLDKLDDSTTKPVPDALKAIGMALVMKVGGASGPLYGTLFMSLGKALPVDGINRAEVCKAFGAAIQAVQARGKSEAGQKTMLDVLIPVHRALADDNTDYAALRHVAEEATAATIPMRAQKGRASFLGERSIGHVDPGARSSALMVSAVCDVMEAHQ